ncbi:hypothetical protein ACFFSW_17185 [Saccharothrix longispora]|jgi:uncharacterized iron-regulated membrane protein|uniref:Iron-regulated membrane protein n=1 Tax=Saccharothrix longispora TaxID=33920 RepID=A0ABU1PSQ3_9PSEU|nr:hypothetical protein [Saccharothrix longispora]MDR6593621.1 putative iron-regulated membrane protein [Saccharothrix longispora]MDU0293321.1 hypothetical protein [Saccharothrix longispora]
MNTATTILTALELAQTQPLQQVNLDGIKNAIFALLGVLLMIVLGVRAFWSYMEDKPGRMVAQIIAAMGCGVFVFFPDTAENILKGVIQSVVGGTA